MAARPPASLAHCSRRRPAIPPTRPTACYSSQLRSCPRRRPSLRERPAPSLALLIAARGLSTSRCSPAAPPPPWVPSLARTASSRTRRASGKAALAHAATRALLHFCCCRQGEKRKTTDSPFGMCCPGNLHPWPSQTADGPVRSSRHLTWAQPPLCSRPKSS